MNYYRLLENKNCVITSGAHGLGYAIARLFAEHGARVAICGLAFSANLLRAISPESFFFKCDLSELNQVDEFGDEVLKCMDHVDVLVNCVGINMREPITEINMEHFDTIQSVNLKAAIQLIGKFVPVMIEKNIHGSIVNISSIHSIAPSAVTGSYAASKGGLNAISRVLALEVGQYGIRTNTLCCGWIATTHIFKELNAIKNDRKKQYAFLEQFNGTAPCLSPARAEDIAQHALFLASDMSSYITGATLMNDGGATIQAHYCDFPEPDDAFDMRRTLYNALLDSEYVR
jgi:NAD(P)-dependent dehydrogenase (short-subunit alcohol dehydrogenase family)